MSKMDALRAMREARYAEDQARAKGQVPASTRQARRPAVAPEPVQAAEPAAAEAAEQLCGHRNMSGRTCTREHGHEAKSHRYS